MAMRVYGYGYCDVCQKTFASSPSDPAGMIRHPTADDYPESPQEWNDMLRRCPDAGKTFRNPMMEEVTQDVEKYRVK